MTVTQLELRVNEEAMTLRRLVNPRQINWATCYRIIPTLQERVREQRDYTDEEHKELDRYAMKQISLGYKGRVGKNQADLGTVTHGVYYPGKDLDVRVTV